MNKEEQKLGTKHVDAANTYLYTLLHTDVVPYQHTQGLTAAAAGHQPATSNSLNEL